MALSIEQQLKNLQYRYCQLAAQIASMGSSGSSILGISGNGGINDPISGTFQYTNAALANIALATGKFTINVNGAIWASFANNGGNVFSFNRASTTITFPSGSFVFNDLDFIQINLNQ